MNGRGADIVSLSTPIPNTTTGLCKPLTDNAPASLAPILASLTDRVNHTAGLAGCTGALRSQMAVVVWNLPVMDVLRLAAASSCAPTDRHLSAPFNYPFLQPFFTAVSPTPTLWLWLRLRRVVWIRWEAYPPPCCSRSSSKNVKIIFRWLVHTPAYSQG